MDFFGKEGLELPDERLDSVAGGLSKEDLMRKFEEVKREQEWMMRMEMDPLHRPESDLLGRP